MASAWPWPRRAASPTPTSGRARVACLALLKRAIKAFALRCVAATESSDCVLDVAVPIGALDAAFEAALALTILLNSS